MTAEGPGRPDGDWFGRMDRYRKVWLVILVALIVVIAVGALTGKLSVGLVDEDAFNKALCENNPQLEECRTSVDTVPAF